MGVQFNIKDAEIKALAEDVGARLGLSAKEAVRQALKDYLSILTRDERLAQVQALVKDNARLWREPITSTNHGDFLYDEMGLPK